MDNREFEIEFSWDIYPIPRKNERRNIVPVNRAPGIICPGEVRSEGTTGCRGVNRTNLKIARTGSVYPNARAIGLGVSARNYSFFRCSKRHLPRPSVRPSWKSRLLFGYYLIDEGKPWRPRFPAAWSVSTRFINTYSDHYFTMSIIHIKGFASYLWFQLHTGWISQMD